jgi:hypothetical protein
MLGDVEWASRYSGNRRLSVLQLLRAVASHRAIVLYAVIALAGFAYTLTLDQAGWRLAQGYLYTLIGYPIVEYVLHRFGLHGTLLCRSKLTAPVWRRVHYDHHMNPQDLTVLFAHPATSVPFLLLLSVIIAALAGDMMLIPATIAGTFTAFIFYEFMHTAAHVGLDTQNTWLAGRCRSHLRHHYLDEKVNFGIGVGLVDWLLRVVAGVQGQTSRSPTVNNLGYDDAMAARYPWVAEGYARRQAAAPQTESAGT